MKPIVQRQPDRWLISPRPKSETLVVGWVESSRPTTSADGLLVGLEDSTHPTKALLWILTVVVGLACARVQADESPLTISDLHAYRAALEGKPGGTPVAVNFRHLWELPKTYEGRRVQVEGKVGRVFRQGAFGTFPPLCEAWAFSPAGDPYCLVFPIQGEALNVKPDEPVRFTGTFLRLVTYQGGDGARLAPLIVGDRPPVTPEAGGAQRAPSSWGSRQEWTLGLVVGAMVVLLLVGQHLRRPPRSILEPDVSDRPPDFIEPPSPEDEDARHEAG